MAADTAPRYARGRQRRNALVEAAAVLLLEQGLASLSHRAVAARAGVPLAATTYYFDSADDLRDEAFTHLAEGWSARARTAVDDLPDRIDRCQAAEVILAVVGADTSSQQALVMYERYLDAGRHPRLRPVVVAWNAQLRELVRRVLARAGLAADDDHADLVLAVADGAAVTSLAQGAPPRAAVGAALRRLLALL